MILLSVAKIRNLRFAGVYHRNFSLGFLEVSGVCVFSGARNAPGRWDHRGCSSDLNNVHWLFL
jgi:hypothetical protein